jgi:hypothetical protein
MTTPESLERKQKELEQWERHLEEIQRNIIINIGTDESKISGSSIDIHNIGAETAQENINRIKDEIERGDEDPDSFMFSILSMQMINARRIMALTDRVESMEKKLRPSNKRRVSTVSVVIVVAVVYTMALIDRIQVYAYEHPELSIPFLILATMLAFVLWWLPQANGNGK